uniref:Secreted protein n=1 Tax=Romanomermis culicivorax TaxID=13658 RepID=A0A915JSJ7_ROMCU
MAMVWLSFAVRRTTPATIATNIHLKFGFQVRLVETWENCSSASLREIRQHQISGKCCIYYIYFFNFFDLCSYYFRAENGK